MRRSIDPTRSFIKLLYIYTTGGHCAKSYLFLKAFVVVKCTIGAVYIGYVTECQRFSRLDLFIKLRLCRSLSVVNHRRVKH